MGQYTIYRSTDVGAPTLSGTAGDLTTLLDAVLVNGYGAKAAAGWTITHTAANKRVYTQGAGSGMGFRVRDNAGGTGGAKEALIRGGESWTDIDTPVGPFPTAAQSALTDSSQVVRKSNTADATTRAWKIFADDKTINMFIMSGDTANVYKSWRFGEIDSYVTADIYACAIGARNIENSTSTAEYTFFFNAGAFTTSLNWIARNYAGLGTSAILGLSGDFAKNGGSAGVKGTIAFLNAPDGGLYISPIYCAETANSYIRGVLRGVYYPLHATANFNDGDTFSGIGYYAGKTFECVVGPYDGSAAAICCIIFETSATLI
jgi:hypothetical protein